MREEIMTEDTTVEVPPVKVFQNLPAGPTCTTTKEKVQEHQPKKRPMESTYKTFRCKDSDQGALRQALEATSKALAASTNSSVVHDSLSSNKTQVIAANLNISQVKAKISGTEGTTRQIEGQLPTLGQQVMEQVDIRNPALSLSKSAQRIQAATEMLSTSVEGFKDGLFGLVQTLVAEQKIMATQMTHQARAFKELVKMITN